jgi:hypothetical protein
MSVHSGGCQCGAVRYEVSGEPHHAALCHCNDCRKSIGAPAATWAAFAEGDFRVTAGDPVTYNSSGAAMRSFCPRCGTSLFYRNAEMLPGIVDILAATLDDPEALPPAIHIQTADRLSYMADLTALPEFERYPG